MPERAARGDAPRVLFLGAGASRPFGVPVTREILPQILRRLAQHRVFRSPAGSRRESQQATAELKKLLLRLLPGLFGAAPPPLITDLLSLLDQLLATGNAPQPDLEPDAVGRLRVLLERGIAEVVESP